MTQTWLMCHNPIMRKRTCKEPHEKNPAAVALGLLGGAKGGRARAKALTPERIKEISRAAARARWDRVRDPQQISRAAAMARKDTELPLA